MNKLSTASYLLLLCLTTPIITVNCWAQNSSVRVTQSLINSTVDKETLKIKIDAINNREGLDETSKSKLLAIYQSAEDNLASIEKTNAQTEEFKAAIRYAPEQTRKLQKELEQVLAKIAKQKSEDFSHIPLEELEQRLILEKGKISQLDEQLNKLENALNLQNSRLPMIREETAAARQDLEAAQKKLEQPGNKADSKLESEARQILWRTIIDARSAELKMLDVEAISNPVRVELLKTEFQLLDSQKATLTPIVTAIETLSFELRQQEAKQMQDALSQAEKAVAGKHVLIQESTKENIQYTRDLQAITEKIEHITEQKTQIDTQTTDIELDFKSAEKKIALAGLSPELGKILREQRRNVSIQDEIEQQGQIIQSETEETSLALFKVEDQLKRLTDIDQELKSRMKRVHTGIAREQRMMIQAELRVLLNNQKELLNKLFAAYSTYLRTLGDLDFSRQQMSSQASKFATYLDERLLWVPSSELLFHFSFLQDLYQASKWLLSPNNWLAFLNNIFQLAFRHLFLSLLVTLSACGLFIGQHWARLRLAMTPVNKIDHFYDTLQLLIYQILVMLPFPVLSYCLGRFLATGHLMNDFTKSVAEGLQNIALPLFFLPWFYRLLSADGLVRKHFQWHKSVVKLLHSEIAWLRFIVIPGSFIVGCTGASKFSTHSDSLGRLALIVMMIAITVVTARLLRPATGVLHAQLHKHPNSWLAKLRYLWYPSAIATPMIIVGFAVAGYYLSALEIQQKLTLSLRLIFLMILIHTLVFRWLTIVNRQLAIANAQQKRKALASAEKHTAAMEEPLLPVDDQTIDIPKINAQTIRLLHVAISFILAIGFWMIWKNLLPAFSFLDHIVLWQHQVVIDNQESYQPITLTNLILAGLYIFISVVSIRNFSGLMELLVFRRLTIEAGSRYAINQLAKYSLFAIGVVSVANELGGSWSQVQWLVAALSVGLGFGLQEIFANMVSGIILLFERPIRIGDTVTIGNVTGRVSRIHMRATTLIDMDQKDLIVPNKTFITSQLTNWTLSDPITRVVIPVNIAYGSDVELAHKVMLDTVNHTPMVLSHPEPSVLLVGFGDSSLNFSICIFVSELLNRWQVAHDLHVRLEKSLREHKIIIPFPQRDVHLRPAIKPSTENLMAEPTS